METEIRNSNRLSAVKNFPIETENDFQNLSLEKQRIVLIYYLIKAAKNQTSNRNTKKSSNRM